MSRSCPYCNSDRTVFAGFSAPVRCLNGHQRRRFRCQNCRRRFSENSTRFSFRFKKRDHTLSSKIFHLCTHGLSNRAIAHMHSISEHCVRLRIRRMARRALIFHTRATANLRILEPLCFDGLENFAGSQYDPNNIQQALGRDSLFIYDFNFAPLNRKGRRSIWQKQRLLQIETRHGRYDPSAIRVATRTIVERLYKFAENIAPFTLVSDEHFQYRKAIHIDLRSLPIQHVTISSKVCRNFQNILFSVNHADLMIRQRIAAFSRETISFSKTPGAMCQKFSLFMLRKNYMSTQFTKVHVRRPEAHLKSPAEHLGLFKRILKFSDIFDEYPHDQQSRELNTDWRCFWSGEVPSWSLRNKKHSRRCA